MTTETTTTGTTTTETETETYDESLVRERRERREAQARLIALAADIRLPGWVHQLPDADSEDSRTGGRLVNADLLGEIWLSYDWRDNTRINISTSAPRDRNGNRLTDSYVNGVRQSLPSISVSALKTAAQIRKDIERRLLPTYLVQLAEYRKRLDETQTMLDRYAATGRQLSQACPEMRLRDGTAEGNCTVTLSTVYGSERNLWIEAKVTSSGRFLDLNIHSVTVEQAIAILKAAGL